jgi:hypothetical protein
MPDSLTRRLERLEQHMPNPDRPWRADDYARWRHQHITAGDPDGLIAQAQARVRAWEDRRGLREEAGNHARTLP